MRHETAIQYGCDDAAIDTAITLTRDTYIEYARAIEPADTGEPVYWRIVFALLTVHSPIHASFAGYDALRAWRARYSRLPANAAAIRRILETTRADDGYGVLYAPTKARYIADFSRAWVLDPTRFERNGDDDISWRYRVQANVRGLGLAKASFAVALCNAAESNVCCIDTHIHALYTGSIAPRGGVRRAPYLAIEDTIRRKAAEHGLSTFVLQWLLWDAKRGTREAHSALTI